MTRQGGKMRALIVYYSLTGNTAKAAEYLEEALKEKQGTEVKSRRLEVLDEAGSFAGQTIRALLCRRAKIKESIFDVTGYDMICLGSPVWALAPAPAVNAYLSRCSGLEGKEAVIFATYGSGLGKERCLNRIEEALIKKGVKGVVRFAVAQSKIADEEKAKAFIKNVLRSSFRRIKDAGAAGSRND